MKTFHILKKKTFSKLHHPVAAALLVSSLSIVAGVSTMAALADNPYYSYSSSLRLILQPQQQFFKFLLNPQLQQFFKFRFVKVKKK